MSYAKLLEEWEDLMRRRPAFREPLAGYREILVAWSRWPAQTVRPLDWDAVQCETAWRKGVPLLVHAPPELKAPELEDLMAAALEFALLVGRQASQLKQFADAWDRAEVTPAALLPGRGGVSGLPAEVACFLGYAGLRPALDAYLAICRQHFSDDLWDLGACPFCGGAPGFTDILANGARRLCCHFCGGGWTYPRLACPYCGSRDSKHFVKFQAEDREEGYLISACRNCGGYLKELDRRVRWNGVSAIIEDWGSPHLDLIARRSGHWRAIPTLIDLEREGTARRGP